MALTLVSRIRPPNRSRSWVSQRVHLLEPARLYPSVSLGRADRCMAEQLLNCPQIGTSFEQMGGEGVAEGMWGDTALDGGTANPSVQSAPHIRGRQAPSCLRDEQRRLALLLERRAP